jgi:hypothetical protein
MNFLLKTYKKSKVPWYRYFNAVLLKRKSYKITKKMLLVSLETFTVPMCISRFNLFMDADTDSLLA